MITTTIESIPEKKQNNYLLRQSRLETIISDNNLGGLLLNPSPTLEYFTGLHFHLSERPVIALIVPKHPLIIILPAFEADQLNVLPSEAKIYTYDENPKTWGIAFQKAFQDIALLNNYLCIESNRLRFLEINFIQQAAPHIQLMSGDEIIASLREIKDQSEVASMRKAAEIAQTAFAETVSKIQTSMTEKDIASELSYQLLKAGSEPDFPFLPIVASGLNSANPHAIPSNRQITKGDVIIIDWGATYNGYFSDITRTLSIGKPIPVRDYSARDIDALMARVREEMLKELER
jgi:Xaa-Pro dipeptidase